MQHLTFPTKIRMLRFSANSSMLFTELPLLQRIAAARQ